MVAARCPVRRKRRAQALTLVRPVRGGPRVLLGHENRLGCGTVGGPA